MTVRPMQTPLAVRYREEFPIFRQSVYLNSCSLGALSRRSRARVNEHLDHWERRGASASERSDAPGPIRLLRRHL